MMELQNPITVNLVF